MIKKYINHANFCIKSFLLHPNQTFKKLVSDIKKDKTAYKFKSNIKSVWCAGLPKSGTTLIEKIFEFTIYKFKIFYKTDLFSR